MNLKQEKLNNAILFFAENMYLTKTKLMKSLYELDFRHFKETGRSVTDLKYYAWDKGPVPTKVYHMFKKDGTVVNDLAEFVRIMPQKNGVRIVNRTDPNIKVFTKREQRILNEIIEIYKEADTEMMSGASHEVNKPWDRTKREKGLSAEIDYLYVIDESAPITIEEALQKQKELKDTEDFFHALCL